MSLLTASAKHMSGTLVQLAFEMRAMAMLSRGRKQPHKLSLVVLLQLFVRSFKAFASLLNMQTRTPGSHSICSLPD